MPENQKKLNLLSEETKAILSYVPHWMIRWGNGLIFVIVALAFFLAWYTRYPDVVPARVVITTKNPVISVSTPISGNIHKIFKNDLEKVEQDEPIFIVKSTLNWEDLKKVESFLTKLESLKSVPSKIDIPTDNVVLSEIQNTYVDLIQELKSYNYIISSNIIAKQIDAIDSQIKGFELLNESLESQSALMVKELDLVASNLKRNESLHEEGTLSTIELERTKAEYLQFERSIKSLNAQLNNNNIQVEKLKMSQLELRKGFQVNLTDNWFAIQQKVKEFKNRIEQWKEQYLVIAPIPGVISYLSVNGEKQFVKQGEELLKILPKEDLEGIIGRALVPITGSGKVEVGMSANIYLDGYPYAEYGVLKAEVKTISPVPQKDNYLLELELDYPFVTTYNKTIVFKQEITGNVEIITADLSLLDRLFHQIRAAFV